MTPAVAAEPAFDCALCPRLKTYRDAWKVKQPDWFCGPAPSFGSETARLLIIGLAPGLKGANRTGRPFTGDDSGAQLYDALAAFGFSRGTYAATADDDVSLVDAMITNAVRCAPPQNRPTGAELAACRPFLLARIASLRHLRAILCIGRVAHESTLRALGAPLRTHPFAHGAQHRLQPTGFDREILVFDSYHCSRYNTNTGRLTTEMFHGVFAAARAALMDETCGDLDGGTS